MLASGHSAGAASPFSANDFEAVVFRQFPQLQTIERKLSKLGAAGVRMTGSGSAIFAIFGSRTERDRAEAVLKGNRVFGRYLVMPAALVSRGSYQTALAAAVTPTYSDVTKAYGRCKAGTQNEV